MTVRREGKAGAFSRGTSLIGICVQSKVSTTPMSTRWRTGSWQSKHTPPPSNLPIRASSYVLPRWLGIIALHFHCILAIE